MVFSIIYPVTKLEFEQVLDKFVIMYMGLSGTDMGI